MHITLPLSEIKQQIVDYANNVIRASNLETREDKICLAKQYNALCCNVLYNTTLTEQQKLELFIPIYRLIHVTNDFMSSNGSYELAYKQICILGECPRNFVSAVQREYEYEYEYNFYRPLMTELAKKAFSEITSINIERRPDDCWREITQLCNYLYYSPHVSIDNKCVDNQSLFNYIIHFIIYQLNEDNSAIQMGITPSTLAFWLPKEKSKRQFGYLTHIISYNMFKKWLMTAEKKSSLYRAENKCLTHYRKLISKLKVYLDLNALRNLSEEYKCGDRLDRSKQADQADHTNEYSSYNHFVYTLCNEFTSDETQEIIDLWNEVLYGDMPELIEGEVEDEGEGDVEDEGEGDVECEGEGEDEEGDEDEDEDEEDDQTTPQKESKGWFSWFFGN